MGYAEEKQRILDLVTDNGCIIELNHNRDNLKKYYREIQEYSNSWKLAIRYPGYKTTATKCDYCVYLVDNYKEHPISHVEIMNVLYNMTTEYNYWDMKRYIEDVAAIGREVKLNEIIVPFLKQEIPFEVLTDLMFYIAIQEDINYPQERFQGRKMCFYRYLEAIYCKVYTNHMIDEAVHRATNSGYIPIKWNDVGDLYDVVSNIQR